MQLSQEERRYIKGSNSLSMTIPGKGLTFEFYAEYSLIAREKIPFVLREDLRDR